MKRIPLLLLAALLAFTVFGCTSPATQEQQTAQTSPTPETTAEATAVPSATPATSLSPSASPTAAVTPTPVPGGPSDAPAEVVESGKIADLAEKSDIIVLGEFTEYKGIWNAARDPKNLQKASETNYLGEKQYTFHVKGVYQGSKLVKKDTDIVVTMPYEAKMESWNATELDETFVEPTLNIDVMLFLNQDNDFDIYYANTDPYYFTLDANNALHVTSYSADTVKAWETKYPSGITLDAFRKALNL